jgi:hypothetical protein
MLSHVVLSAIQVFHPLWCWLGLCLYESVMVFHPSRRELTVWGSMLWFEQWLERCRWLVMLSHAVLSVEQVFHPLWCWVGLCLYESVMVFHPSRHELTVWGSMLWFERCRWLTHLRHVVLESAKDQILGVDPLGEHVPPHVSYGTVCLLIVGGHKMHIFTAIMPTFHSRYRR